METSLCIPLDEPSFSSTSNIVNSLSSGHLFLSAPDGTPQLVVDSGQVSQQQPTVETTAEKANTQQVHLRSPNVLLMKNVFNYK